MSTRHYEFQDKLGTLFYNQQMKLHFIHLTYRIVSLITYDCTIIWSQLKEEILQNRFRSDKQWLFQENLNIHHYDLIYNYAIIVFAILSSFKFKKYLNIWLFVNMFVKSNTIFEK